MDKPYYAKSFEEKLLVFNDISKEDKKLMLANYKEFEKNTNEKVAFLFLGLFFDYTTVKGISRSKEDKTIYTVGTIYSSIIITSDSSSRQAVTRASIEEKGVQDQLREEFRSNLNAINKHIHKVLLTTPIGNFGDHINEINTLVTTLLTQTFALSEIKNKFFVYDKKFTNFFIDGQQDILEKYNNTVNKIVDKKEMNEMKETTEEDEEEEETEKTMTPLEEKKLEKVKWKLTKNVVYNVTLAGMLALLAYQRFCDNTENFLQD